MTENLAARGEGLAGLVAERDRINVMLAEFSAKGRDCYDSMPYVVGKRDGINCAIAALEAAAPPSTAHAEAGQDFEQLVWRANDLLDRAKEAMECDPEADNVGGDCWTWIKQTEIWLEELNRAAALATPSPQAPRLTVGNITGVLFNAGVSLTSPVAHRVTDELNAVISWQEQPAGSGASDSAFLSELRDAVLLVPNMLNELGDLDDSGGEPEYAHTHPLKNIVSNVKAHCLGVCISIDEKLGGSPRKVGEDGAPEKYERTHSRVWTNAWNAAIEECAKHLREGWSVANKDNGDDVMEVLMEELGGLMLPTPSIVGGPSSVPVGEQKEQK